MAAKVINLTTSDDTYDVGVGNYFINGLGGDNTITTGAGDSTVTVGNGNNTITTGAGNGIVLAGGGNNTITTGAGDSKVTTGNGNDTITTGAGNGIVLAGGGNNTITTGAGDSKVTTGNGNDTITTGAGNDVIYSGSGNDTVTTGAGNDVVIYVAAENFNTAITGTSTYNGGTGIDTLRLMFTRAEWMSSAVQAEVSNYQKFLATNTGTDSEANAATFKFATFGLTAGMFEKLEVIVDGVSIDPANHAVTLGNDALSTFENEASVALDVLTNDSVPDLINNLTYTNPAHGSVQLTAAYSDTAAVPAAKFIYTPVAGFYDYLAIGGSASDAFTYTVTDATGDVKTATVSVTITGTNDAASISGLSTGSVKEDGTLVATGVLTVSDVDTGESIFSENGAFAGKYGNFTFANNVWVYTLSNGAANVQALSADNTVYDTLLVHSKDGTASQEIKIAITGVNEAVGNGISAGSTQGFEDGSFAGWKILGSAKVVTAYGGYIPTDGNYFGLLNGTGANASSIESFLGIANGKLNSLGNGTATSGSAIKTSVALETGDVLKFDWAFKANDYLPYNDFSFIVTANGQISELADVKTVSNYGFSGWHHFSYTATEDMVFELGLGVTNVLDNALNSQLLIDNFFII